MTYALSATLVSFGVAHVLQGRNVPLRAIWHWGPLTAEATTPLHRLRAWMPGFCSGVGPGLLLGIVGIAYLALLKHWPPTADALQRAQQLAAARPVAWPSLFVAAVFVAPAAEEFLFRGLLYKAMARDWPGWQAVLVSAAFFASYHPVLSWLPVALVGIACALMFRRTERLASAVALHATYNAVVVGWQWVG